MREPLESVIIDDGRIKLSVVFCHMLNAIAALFYLAHLEVVFIELMHMRHPSPHLVYIVDIHLKNVCHPLVSRDC